MKKKVVIETKPVSWAGQSVLKYQSFASLEVTSKRTISICGDPKSTEEQAKNSLREELNLFEELVRGGLDEIS